ncbi:MAG: UvrD-helicase domain-containing protein [Gemmatimonadales bacterium]|nr:UvrD-helicase domain-containing protein [Gemmatimonadales bacterium]
MSDRPDWLVNLNPEQRAAVEHVHGPLLVLAGAGSGKTRVLTSRIANLIESQGVPPERIFAVTFTNKAAGEMKHRVGQLLRRDPAGLWIGTFHSLSARLLRREAELLGFTRQFTIYDEDDREALVRRLLERRGHSPKTFTPRAVAGLISAAKNRMQDPAALAEASPFDRLAKVAAEVFGDMGPALRAANAMDFDDLLLHPLLLFQQHPARRAAWQERFAFVLVDEFQDTNRAQYELVRHLGGHGNVCAVGDDDQSIYGWRGANVGNMRDFQRDFPATVVVRLEENYRSTQVILDAANAVIEQNQGRLGKTLRTRRRGGEPVTVVTAADERDEAEWIVRELGRRRAAGDFEARDMAVLYRTNAQSRALEEACRRAGLPYRLVGATSFYDRREVKDLLAYLRLVANPRDDEAFLRAIAVPRRGLGEASVAQLLRTAQQWEQPLLAAARHAERVPDLRPNVRNALTGFAALIDRVAGESRHLAPAEVLERIIEGIKYEDVLAAEGPEGADRWENVRELVAGAAEWSEVAAPEEESTPLERFLAEAALLSSHDAIAGDEQGLTLMTLHTAKGLEWPLVVLSGMEHGLFPLGRAEEQPGGLEEERRLCYVGLTRARDALYLTWAQSRRRGGELRHGIRSAFLDALPPGGVTEQRSALVFSVGRGSAAWGTPRAPAPPGRSMRWDDADLPAPAVEETSQDTPRYVKGERVRHRRFGTGAITGLSGTGRDLKVTVVFDDAAVGAKQLLVAYAGLERDWEDA